MRTMGPILEVDPDVDGSQYGSGLIRSCLNRLLPRSELPDGLDAKGHHVILGPSCQYQSNDLKERLTR